MNRISIIFLVLVFICGVVEAANYGGGSGVEGDPYLISGSDHLEELADNPDDWDKHFKMRNYFIPFARHNSIGVYVGPDSEDNIPFTGVFDGNGGGILPTSSVLPENKNTGIFGYIGAGGVVKNLYLDGYIGLEGAEIAGGLAVLNEGTIENCEYGMASVFGGKIVGGYAGINRGLISRCSIGPLVQSSEVKDIGGGIAGINDGGRIENCLVEGVSFEESEYSGGIAGISMDGFISGCSSYFYGNGPYAVGGLIGSSNNDMISNSFSHGWARGGQFAGGLVGYCVGSDLTNCYSTAKVTSDGTVGGIIGYRDGGVVSGCFWDTEKCEVGLGVGQGSGEGMLGKTSAEMLMSETFLVAGWDFIGESDNGTEDIWIMSHGRYEGPVQVYYRFQMAGDGSAEDPYQVVQAVQLYFLSGYGMDKNYVLMADIDMDDKIGFRPFLFMICPYPDMEGFSGVFDGNGHTISNYVYEPDSVSGWQNNYAGFFGYVNNGVIKNLTLKNTFIDVGDGFVVGGLVGMSENTSIENCHVEGSVIGGNSVGGLVGESQESDIRNCSFSGSVTGDEHVGGLAGVSTGIVRFSYSDAAVSGGDYVGGLIGDGGAENCYARGTVSGNSYVGGLIGVGGASESYAACSVNGDMHVGGISGGGSVHESCLVDIDVLGQSGGAVIDGVGKGTAEMQLLSTYVDAGLDIAGEIVNGASDFWVLPGGDEYPVLWWQLGESVALPVFSGGSGVEDDPYLLKTVDDLNSIGCNPRLMDKYFLVSAEIDLEGGKVHSIGCEYFPFEGWFVSYRNNYSNRYVIRNIGGFESDRKYIGLFGYIGEDGLVGLIELEGFVVDRYTEDIPELYDGQLVGVLAGYNAGEILGCKVEGELRSGSSAGGLVGKNDGYIDGCRFKGKVTGVSELGGLVYYNSDGGEIHNSSFKGSIEVDYSGSGLVIFNIGLLADCYARGEVVSKHGKASGLVKSSGGVIRHCYSACAVNGNDESAGLVGWSNGEIYDCFWDREVAGTERGVGGYESDPAGVIGLPTAEMMMVSPYANAEWDIQSRQPMKRENLGAIWMDRYIWSVCDGVSYPQISWDLRYDDFQCPDGVGYEDFALLADVWGLERGDSGFPWDYEQIGGDNNGVVDVGDLIGFAENWLKD